jgi:hypothetical protein
MVDDSGQFRVSEVHRRVAIPLQSQFPPVVLVASEVEGQLLVEGDIAVGPESLQPSGFGAKMRDLGRVVLESIGIAGAGFRWTGARIPFEILSGNNTSINEAIAHWHANTPIRLVPRTKADTDYVVFRASSSGSDSEVGKRRPGQFINIKLTARVPVIIHEIGHAVGLWHEHTRDDRDTYVEVIEDNIDPTAMRYFDIHDIDGDKLGSAYDFASLMHYPPSAFAKEPQNPARPSIRGRNGETFGQAVGLSVGDINAVRTMYP